MKILIIINLVAELLVGLALLLAAKKLPDFKGTDGSGITMARMYGVAAIMVGVLSYFVLQDLDNAVLVNYFLQSMILFHIGIAAVTLAAHFTKQMNGLGPGIFHTLMAIGFIYFLMQ